MKTERQFIATGIGKIAVYQKLLTSDKTPLIFLHGVYFDHHLWDAQFRAINDRSIFALDMPLHGKSREVSRENWNLNDCAEMLLEILNSLQIPKVTAVGHSWGSMTILRAAAAKPERFEHILLCNMPFEAASKKQKVYFGLQHTLLAFRHFYTTQAAKALFGKTSLTEKPTLTEELRRSMGILSDNDIRQIDKKVILEADDTTNLILNLTVKATALKGEEDYVPTPPHIETKYVNGGHVSPLECPKETTRFIQNALIQAH